ncbi:MAG: hypothetical protein CL955_10490 [Erythrobacteraceae bacterium]|nr:hypothetical protein [Erythrobacteraceae bacterium]
MALQSQGRLETALPMMREALDVARKTLGENNRDTLRIMSNLANLMRELDMLDEALEISAQALRLKTETLGETHEDTLVSLNGYGAILMSMGRHTEAEPVFDRSLRIRREKFGDEHPLTLNALLNYSNVLANLGRMREALPIVSAALDGAREVYGNRHPTTLRILLSRARVLNNLGKYEDSLTIYKEAIPAYYEELGGRHPDTIHLLQNYASTIIDLGRAPDAIEILEMIQPRSEEVLGDFHSTTLAIIANLAVAHDRAGRKVEAERGYTLATQRSQDAFGAQHKLALQSKENLLDFLVDEEKFPAAVTTGRELLMTLRWRTSQLQGGDLRGDSQSLRETDALRRNEKLYADALWGAFGQNGSDHETLSTEAFVSLQNASAGSASRAVQEAAAARFASALGLQQVIREREELARNWRTLEADFVKSQAGGADVSSLREELRRAMSSIETRIEDIDQMLERDAQQYFSIQKQQSVSLEEIRKVLNADEAILLLVPSARGTHAMAISGDTIGWARSSKNADAIARLVSDLRAGLEIQGGDGYLPFFDLDLAYDLYSKLIAPIEDAIKGKSRVYVVADGALSRLPLGTLITSPVGQGFDSNDPAVLRSADWLADRYALVQLPSLQSLVYIRSFGIDEGDTGEAGFAGFGAPVLGGEARLRGARSATLDAVDAAFLVGELRGSSGLPLMNPEALRKLAALPGTKSELEQVRSALGASEASLFLADRMTETAIRSADLSTKQILHLATHGFTSEESGATAEPGLVFTPPEEAMPEDDGYLTASEVLGLDLTAAEWVILSACNTASPSGQPGETGLSGLARAFFYAGAESLLVSHWPVFDDIAPVLTVETLKRSQAGQPRAEALQAAMRKIRMDPALDAAHPAVWAPFALVGEGR